LKKIPSGVLHPATKRNIITIMKILKSIKFTRRAYTQKRNRDLPEVSNTANHQTTKMNKRENRAQDI
jgi:hypothetical protein